MTREPSPPPLVPSPRHLRAFHHHQQQQPASVAGARASERARGDNYRQMSVKDVTASQVAGNSLSSTAAVAAAAVVINNDDPKASCRIYSRLAMIMRLWGRFSDLTISISSKHLKKFCSACTSFMPIIHEYN